MSCYEEEQGSYTIPAGQWSAFKTKLRKSFVEFEEFQYLAALVTWERIKSKPASETKMESELFIFKGKSYHKFAVYTVFYELKKHLGYIEPYALHNMKENILNKLFMDNNEYKKKPKKPVKKDYIKAMKRDTFSESNFDIIINEDSKSVSWSVDNNNNSVSTSRSHPVGKTLFSLLNKIKWTSKTGGYVLYQSEFTKENFSGPSTANPLGGIGKDAGHY